MVKGNIKKMRKINNSKGDKNMEAVLSLKDYRSSNIIKNPLSLNAELDMELSDFYEMYTDDIVELELNSSDINEFEDKFKKRV